MELIHYQKWSEAKKHPNANVCPRFRPDPTLGSTTDGRMTTQLMLITANGVDVRVNKAANRLGLFRCGRLDERTILR